MIVTSKRGFARNFTKKPSVIIIPWKPNPFAIPKEVKDRVVNFCERRLKKFEKRDKTQRYVVFNEFTDKTHEFEVFIRDESMFPSRGLSPKIKIKDKDLAPEKIEKATNGWTGFEVNPYFDLQDSKHSLTPI
jgi:hypothetical protein